MADTPAREPRSQRSLFGEILDWMLAPLLLVWPMSVALTWLVAQGIASRPYDRQLGQMVQMVARQLPTSPGAAGVPLKLPEAAAALLRQDDVDRIYFQVRSVKGDFLAGDRDLRAPDGDRAGSGEVQFRDDDLHNQPVRVGYLWLTPAAAADAAVGRALEDAAGIKPDDAVGIKLEDAVGVKLEDAVGVVQVAETLDKRSRLATEIIKGVILPQFVILPLAVLLVWFALARGIAPLNQLQQRIRRRDSTDLSAIDEGDVPEEVAPLVRSINELLARLDQSMSSQKHFLADAAHQLKTPLAGLRTQAELAQREIDAGHDPQSVKRSLQGIARASQRAAHMVNQLLSLARAEDREQSRRLQPFNLARLATETVRDFVPRAMDKHVDLGYEGPGPSDDVPKLLGQPVLVRELVRNLVDNALQYTPDHGTVTVRVVADPFGQVVVLQVEDSGPGIAAAERELVFQPFYRTLGTGVDGSGLGLAIVREIARQHQAEVEVEDTHAHASAGAAEGAGSGPGARFTVRFPVQAAGL